MKGRFVQANKLPALQCPGATRPGNLPMAMETMLHYNLLRRNRGRTGPAGRFRKV